MYLVIRLEKMIFKIRAKGQTNSFPSLPATLPTCANAIFARHCIQNGKTQNSKGEWEVQGKSSNSIAGKHKVVILVNLLKIMNYKIERFDSCSGVLCFMNNKMSLDCWLLRCLVQHMCTKDSGNSFWIFLRKERLARSIFRKRIYLGDALTGRHIGLS